MIPKDMMAVIRDQQHLIGGDRCLQSSLSVYLKSEEKNEMSRLLPVFLLNFMLNNVMVRQSG